MWKKAVHFAILLVQTKTTKLFLKIAEEKNVNFYRFNSQFPSFFMFYTWKIGFFTVLWFSLFFFAMIYQY